MSRIRIVPAIVAFFVTLALLFGGWAVYRNYGLVHPVEQDLLHIYNVTHADVIVNNQNRSVKVEVSEVKDLQSTYTKLRQIVDQSLGADTQIDVTDSRSSELTELYQTYQPILFEGIHKGNYVEMIQSIVGKAKQSGVNAKITMDKNHVFIQLSKDNKQLDEIVTYSNQQQQGVSP
jgi:hypothetical protein